MNEPITLTEEELGSALAAHAREEYPDELYDYLYGDVTYQDHTCHSSCAEDVLRRVLASRSEATK